MTWIPVFERRKLYSRDNTGDEYTLFTSICDVGYDEVASVWNIPNISDWLSKFIKNLLLNCMEGKAAL